jgi:hypothetical protein
MKHLPRLTSQSSRQQMRDQGLDGIFVEFVHSPALSTEVMSSDVKKKQGMARSVG